MRQFELAPFPNSGGAHLLQDIAKMDKCPAATIYKQHHRIRIG